MVIKLIGPESARVLKQRQDLSEDKTLESYRKRQILTRYRNQFFPFAVAQVHFYRYCNQEQKTEERVNFKWKLPYNGT